MIAAGTGDVSADVRWVFQGPVGAKAEGDDSPCDWDGGDGV